MKAQDRREPEDRRAVHEVPRETNPMVHVHDVRTLGAEDVVEGPAHPRGQRLLPVLVEQVVAVDAMHPQRATGDGVRVTVLRDTEPILETVRPGDHHDIVSSTKEPAGQRLHAPLGSAAHIGRVASRSEEHLHEGLAF